MRTKSNHDRFPIVKRGYDPEIVEAHLAEVAHENDRTLDEAAAQIAGLETALDESRKHEEAVHLTILAATKTKEDMLEVAQRQADETRANGRKAGDGIITDARMQAFQVVTEARKEAEGIVAEARSEAASLARIEQVDPVTGDAASERERQLQDRIEEMQTVIAAMESELISRRSLAPSADIEAVEPLAETEDQPIEAVVPTPDDSPKIADDAVDDPAMHGPVMESEDHIEIVVTHTAPAAVAPDAHARAADHAVEGGDAEPDPDASFDDASITDERTGNTVRRSFYSRRSAKLPRIGVEAGRGAMAAAAGLRSNPTAEEQKPESESVHSPALETI